MKTSEKKYTKRSDEIEDLRRELYEANETIDAIRTGQVDALIVHREGVPQLYTLQSADHAYRIFVEKMTEGAVTLNGDGIILYSNTTFAEMTGVTLAKVTGAAFDSFLAPEFSDSFHDLFKKSHSEDCKGETQLYAKGRNVPVLVSCTFLEDSDVFNVIVTNLTEQKEVQEQLLNNNYALESMNRALETSNRDLLQFASVASHDLQEPVRKIRIFSSFLKEKEFDKLGDESKKHLEKIISSAGRMRMLITDMLDYSQLSSDMHGFEDVNIAEILDEVFEDLELIIAEKKAQIRVGTMPVIRANRGQLRQVFQNLISNALKFAKKDLSVVIDITAKNIAACSFSAAEEPGGPYILFSVKDNGIGFDEEYAANMFNLFTRLNSKDAYEGTGIGLAITQKIIEKHRGLIKAQNVKTGGSDFLIILPTKQ